MPASAVGPSSQGLWKTKWSLAETAANPCSTAASTVLSKPAQRQRLVAERHLREVDAEVHAAVSPASAPRAGWSM